MGWLCVGLLLLAAGGVCGIGGGSEADDDIGEGDDTWVRCKVETNDLGYPEVACNMTNDGAPLIKFEGT